MVPRLIGVDGLVHPCPRHPGGETITLVRCLEVWLETTAEVTLQPQYRLEPLQTESVTPEVVIPGNPQRSGHDRVQLAEPGHISVAQLEYG